MSSDGGGAGGTEAEREGGNVSDWLDVSDSGDDNRSSVSILFLCVQEKGWSHVQREGLCEGGMPWLTFRWASD